jgi:cysteinyl-tRNA synthetase
MKLKNSIDNSDFDLDKLEEIKMYICGPTIYNDSHIGHARTYIIYDTMIKYLRSKGKKVIHAMNITDVDDKIINKVHKIFKETYNTSEVKHEDQLFDIFYEFIQEQEARFFEDMEILNVSKPDKIARVTDYIKDMISYIDSLIQKGFAYESNGSVYFDTQAYSKKYPFVLSNANDSDISVKTEYNSEKRNIKDFALWKKQFRNDISWQSKWGYGRLGWHLECSVMMHHMLGETVDVHGGGIDLKFPHHHNEYCQTTAYLDNPDWIKCFTHTGHLLVVNPQSSDLSEQGHLHINKEKMSQSLGNFITIKDFLKSYTPAQIRILFLLSNYDRNMDLEPDSMNYALSVEKRLFTAFKNLESEMNKNDIVQTFDDYDERITYHFDNNFDTPSVFKEILKFIDEAYKSNKKELYLSYYMFLKKWFDILGIEYSISTSEKIDDFVETIIEIRNQIRDIALLEANKEIKIKLFKLADSIRDEKLKSLGVKLEDGSTANKWYFI